MIAYQAGQPGWLAPNAVEQLQADARRIVIVGARGWIGRTLLELLRLALSGHEFDRRVVCVGSAEQDIVLEDGTHLVQIALQDLHELPPLPTMMFHLAFLTMDQATVMAEAAYCAANRALSQAVFDALDQIGVDRLFVASSGAAAFAGDTSAAAALRLYGGLKLEDELRFSGWANDRAVNCRVTIGRIYSVSGPWVNKFSTYALASFILDVIARRSITVLAKRRVLRSYVAVRELFSVILAMMLSQEEPNVRIFDTGGEAIELGELATIVAQVMGGTISRNAIIDPKENRYVGDTEAWKALLSKYGMTHLPIEGQIKETATWLSRQNIPKNVK